jgi:hypothetical protein
MVYAWLYLENEFHEGPSRDDPSYGPARMFAADTKAELVAQVNAALMGIGGGHNGRDVFRVQDYEAKPGSIDLGQGIIARLQAAHANGHNIVEAREPVAE